MPIPLDTVSSFTWFEHAPRLSADISYLCRIRAVRSLAAVGAGLIREMGEITLPPGLRRSRLYSTMVGATLQFLIERVGQVGGTYPRGSQVMDHFLVARTLGDGIDMAGWIAFGASPGWVLVFGGPLGRRPPVAERDRCQPESGRPVGARLAAHGFDLLIFVDKTAPAGTPAEANSARSVTQLLKRADRMQWRGTAPRQGC